MTYLSGVKKMVSILLLLLIAVNHLNIFDAVSHLQSSVHDGKAKTFKDFAEDEKTEKETESKEKTTETEKFFANTQTFSTDLAFFNTTQHGILYHNSILPNPFTENTTPPPNIA